MMREVVVQGLSPREEEAWTRARAKRDLVEWLRDQAAAREGERRWYAVRTRRDDSDSVAERMERRGVTVWCPMKKAVKRLPRRRAKVEVEAPVFSRYLFVKLVAFEGALLGIMTFDGVDCILGTSAGPEPLPERIVAKIQAIADNAAPDTSMLMRAGDQVLIRAGAFASCVGAVLADEGAACVIDVEIDLLGRMVPCRMNVDDLEKLS
jgi:transcription antitermination factor NusG